MTGPRGEQRNLPSELLGTGLDLTPSAKLEGQLIEGPDIPLDCFGDPHVVVIEVVDELTWKTLHRDREGRVLRYTDAKERQATPLIAMVPAEPQLAATAEAWELAQSDVDVALGPDSV